MRFPRAALIESGQIEDSLIPVLENARQRGTSGYIHIYSGMTPGELYIILVRGNPEVAIYSDGEMEAYGRRAIDSSYIAGSNYEIYLYERADLISSLFPEGRIRMTNLVSINAPAPRPRPVQPAPQQPIRPPETPAYQYVQPASQQPQPNELEEQEIALRNKIAEKTLREAEIRRLEKELKSQIMAELREEIQNRPVATTTVPSRQTVQRPEPVSPPPQPMPRPVPAANDTAPLNDELAELERKIEERKNMLASMKMEAAQEPSPTPQPQEEKISPRISINPQEILKKDEEFKKRSEDIKRRIEEELMRKRMELSNVSASSQPESEPERKREPQSQPNSQLEKQPRSQGVRYYQEQDEEEETSMPTSRKHRSSRPEAEGSGLFEQLIEMNKELKKPNKK